VTGLFADASEEGPQGTDERPVHAGFRLIDRRAMVLRRISLVPSPMHVSIASWP
jgi:hypothetical protein